MNHFPVIIVPVFNAYEALDACLASLRRHLPSHARLLLFDDASSDPRIEPLCRAFMQQMPDQVWYVRHAQNLGFPANANLAMRAADGADVVLLNSDTQVTCGWLDRIVECANSDPKIASITPWTNNGEICSFPRFIEKNPEPEDAESIALAASRLGPEYIELPTAVGFCMYVRRQTLDQVGDFDVDTFGKGYGEENDWCMRAAQMGWKHVLCNRAYIVHSGAASFGATGHSPGGENLQRLCARWPTYNEQIARFIMMDPLREARLRLEESIQDLAKSGPQSDLFKL